MNKKKRIAVIGGDLRQVGMAEQIAFDGNYVKSFGLVDENKTMDGIISCNTLQEAIADVDIILLPLPATKNDVFINTPNVDMEVEIQELFQAMIKNQIVLGGKFEEQIIKMAEAYSIHLIDYFDREELNVLNAIPTAEGILQIALEEMPVTLHSSNCLVIGFGRVGKLTANLFHGIGANISVCARKHSDIAWIKGYGYQPIYAEHLNEELSRFDLIINTVPHLILGEESLLIVKDDCLIIDIASKPGGADRKIGKGEGDRRHFVA